MKAKIFYIDEVQNSLVDTVTQHLRKNVYDNIEIIQKPIERDYNKKTVYEYHSNGEQYIRLLRKSVLTLNDFSLLIRQKEDNTVWCYMGYEYRSERSLFGKCIEIFDDEIINLFPAVALINRMVMLPRGVLKLLSLEKHKDPYFDFLFKPYHLQGAKFVDFNNGKELASELSSLKIELHNELKQYYNRYIEQISVPDPDLSQLYKLLDLKKEYVESKKEDFESKKIRIECIVLNGPFIEGVHSEVQLKIYKENTTSLGEISITIKGPKGTLEDFRETLVFDKNEKESQDISFYFSPSTTPFCPLELSMSLRNKELGYNTFPIPIILDIEKSVD